MFGKIFLRNIYVWKTILLKACFATLLKSHCIDLIVTNSLGSFQNCVIETGVSDFYKMIVTVMKTSYRKIESRVIN